MSLSESLNLLRDYADRGDEAAFRELVSRYIDLVYSTAVRRANGDAELARDVTQTVFTDLARKAKSLRDVEFLGGWLHRHTGFVAATMIRSERRRQAREQEAAEMNALENSPDALWQQLAPVLDETIDSLDAADRKAILLRFFERRDFQSIGTALGISDDAAQKRVSRALEKLRSMLANRGVTLSVALLATLLAGKTVSAAPAGIAAQVATVALAGAVSGAGAAFTLTKLAGSLGFKLVVGAAVIGVATLLLWPQLSNSRHGSARQGNIAAAPATSGSVQGAAASNPTPTATDSATFAVVANAMSNKLVLHIVTADTGQPIPMVTIDYTRIEGTNRLHEVFQSTRFGVCVVPVPRNTTTRLFLWSQSDGFVDTWLNWQTDRGDAIPDEYTLRLMRAVKIGGTVVDADGQPVSGASIGFGGVSSAAQEAHPEARAVAAFVASSDAEGRWSLNRIAPEVLRSLEGSASHPEFVRSANISLASDSEAEEQLLAGTYIFRLGRGVTLSGVVTDPAGQPVPDASIRISAMLANSGFGTDGFRTSELRRTTNQSDGTFVVTGCAPGENRISVEADGFVPENLVVEVTSNSIPLNITMQRGGRIRLRIVDQRAFPVAGAEVEFRLPTGGVVRRTNADGQLNWDGVPSHDVAIDIRARGYKWVENLEVEADGQQHDVILERGLALSGTIRDLETGQPIRNFRITPGWPTRYFGMTNVEWQSSDRIPWIVSDDGVFRRAVKEATDADTSLVFKFEAEGHAPFVTRVVKSDEGEVHFDIALRPATAITITVLHPDGKPAAGADVGLVYPGARLRLIPGGFLRNDPSGGRPLAANAEGQFSLPPDDTIERVIGADAEGYGEATREQLLSDPTIQLQPWGRIEGTFLSGGQPAPNRVVQFQYGLDVAKAAVPPVSFNTLSSDPIAYSAESDKGGHFVFPKVPPGKHGLAERRSINSNTWRSVSLAGVEIRPGETNTIIIGGSNYSVIARLRWPAGMESRKDLRISAVLQAPLPPKTQPGTPIARLRPFSMIQNADGSWVADDVPPGDYTLFAAASKPSAVGSESSITAQAILSITVPAEPATGVLNIGEVVLEPSPQTQSQ